MKLQIVPVLYPQEEELKEPILRDFMETDEFRYYVEDSKVCTCECAPWMKRLCAVLMLPFLFPDNKGILGFDERLHRVRETLQKEKDVHTVTHAQLEQYKVELACL